MASPVEGVLGSTNVETRRRAGDVKWGGSDGRNDGGEVETREVEEHVALCPSADVGDGSGCHWSPQLACEIWVGEEESIVIGSL